MLVRRLALDARRLHSVEPSGWLAAVRLVVLLGRLVPKRVPVLVRSLALVRPRPLATASSHRPGWGGQLSKRRTLHAAPALPWLDFCAARGILAA